MGKTHPPLPLCTLIPPQDGLDKKSTGDITSGFTGYLRRKSSSSGFISLFISRTWGHDKQECLWIVGFLAQQSFSTRWDPTWRLVSGATHSRANSQHKTIPPYLEGELSDVRELITFKQASDGVLEGRVSDALNQVGHFALKILVWLGHQNRFMENHTERLRSKRAAQYLTSTNGTIFLTEQSLQTYDQTIFTNRWFLLVFDYESDINMWFGKEMQNSMLLIESPSMSSKSTSIQLIWFFLECVIVLHCWTRVSRASRSAPCKEVLSLGQQVLIDRAS